MWLTKLIGFLTGGILNSVLKYFSDKEKFKNDEQRLRADLITTAVHAEIETRKVLVAQMRVDNETPATRWIRPSFAYPLSFYFSAVIIDSVFNFSWDVKEMPPTMMSWAGVIIVFYFGGRTVEKVAKIWKSRRK